MPPSADSNSMHQVGAVVVQPLVSPDDTAARRVEARVGVRQGHGVYHTTDTANICCTSPFDSYRVNVRFFPCVNANI